MSDNYWTRKLARQGVSRRRVLGGAALAGVGTASMALVGCGDDDDDTTPGATNTPGSGGQTPQPGATPTPDPNAMQIGGTYRGVSANNTWDTFDIDRSRFSPVAWLFALTNLGVMQWKSFTDGELEGGIAESYELVDDTTMVFKIRPNVFWHNKPPVNGRQATPTMSSSSSSATSRARPLMASTTRTSTGRPHGRPSMESKKSTT